MLTHASITTIKPSSSHTWCVQAPLGPLVWLQLTPKITPALLNPRQWFTSLCLKADVILHLFHCVYGLVGARRGSWLSESSKKKKKKGTDWGNNIAQSTCLAGSWHPKLFAKSYFSTLCKCNNGACSRSKNTALLQGWFINIRYDICIKQQIISAVLEAIYTWQYQIPALQHKLRCAIA